MASTEARDRAPITLDSLRGTARRRRKETAVRGILLGFASLSVVVGALIVLSLAGEAWTFISQVDPAALGGDGWYPRRGSYDVKSIVVSSLVVTGVAMAFATPLGLGAAIYLSEYARPRVRKVLKPVLEILAGIPSVVVGFFALVWINPEIVQRTFGGADEFNRLAAGIGVGILIIPLVASISEDAMAAVPRALREAAYGLGARKVTAAVRVVVPAAVSGLVAALIVAVSRAIGETMVVYIAGGLSGVFSPNPVDPGITMTAAIASIASGTDRVVGEDLTFQSLFFVGALLFFTTFTLNVFADRVVRRTRQVY